MVLPMCNKNIVAEHNGIYIIIYNWNVYMLSMWLLNLYELKSWFGFVSISVRKCNHTDNSITFSLIPI
jgi:hypothetical protein